MTEVASHVLIGFSHCAKLDNRWFYEGRKYLVHLLHFSFSLEAQHESAPCSMLPFSLGPKLVLLGPPDLTSQKERDLGLLEPSRLKLCSLASRCVEEFILYLRSSFRVDYREARCLTKTDRIKRKGKGCEWVLWWKIRKIRKLGIMEVKYYFQAMPTSKM